jgi:hypothetical protein
VAPAQVSLKWWGRLRCPKLKDGSDNLQTGFYYGCLISRIHIHTNYNIIPQSFLFWIHCHLMSSHVDAFVERVLEVVMPDDRRTAPHFLGDYRVYPSFFWALFERFCCPFRWSQPPVRVRCCIVLIILDYYCLVCIIIDLLLCDCYYFIYWVFHMHVSICIRGGTVTPVLFYLFWGVTYTTLYFYTLVPITNIFTYLSNYPYNNYI